MSKLIFKCSNISKSFYQGNKTVEVLKNIDFTLEQSTSVSIVGPSGSGKTTFLNVLSGLDSPSAGKVFYKEKDINNLIEMIESIIIEFLKLYKIKSYADAENIGIWVKNKKIASIGIRVSNWVAYHGFSINISNNLKYYKKIIPCGLNNAKITSVKIESKNKILNKEEKLSNIFIKKLKNI